MNSAAKWQEMVLQPGEVMFIFRLPIFSAHNNIVFSERCCWHPAAPWAHSISCHVTVYKLPSFRKKSILHREKVKRSMNVIFYLLFSVGWCWNFCSCHELVNQSCQDTSCFGFSLRWPLVPPVLTADVSSMILLSILWEAAFL